MSRWGAKRFGRKAVRRTVPPTSRDGAESVLPEARTRTPPIGRSAFPGFVPPSRFFLFFGIERFGGEFAVGFFEKDFDAAFGFFELLLAFALESDTFFKEFHGVVERELRGLEPADDFFEARERTLEVRLLGRLRFFWCRGIHAIGLCPLRFVS
jgi:hypothetical protein